MALRRCVTGLLAAAACLAAGWAPVAGAAPAVPGPRTLELTLEFWSGGIRVLRQEVSLQLRSESYRLAVGTETLGLPNLLFRFSQTAVAQGVLTRDGPQPERFAVDSDGRFGSRQVLMTFGPGSEPTARLQPPPEDDEDREPVTAEHRQGSLDPLSALLSAAAGPEPCVGSLAVFDGRRRYDLRMTRVGSANVAPTAYSAYSGPALHCRLAMEPVAGFTREWLRERGSDTRPSDIWFARLDDPNLMIPVRMEAQSRFGWVIAHLVKAEVNSQTVLARRAGQ